jgi:hypothetical protein
MPGEFSEDKRNVVLERRKNIGFFERFHHPRKFSNIILWNTKLNPIKSFKFSVEWIPSLEDLEENNKRSNLFENFPMSLSPNFYAASKESFENFPMFTILVPLQFISNYNSTSFLLLCFCISMLQRAQGYESVKY